MIQRKIILKTLHKKILLISLTAILGGMLLFSTISLTFPKTMPQQLPVEEQNRTKAVELLFKDVPNNCYIIYENPSDVQNNDTVLTFYNTTSLAIYNLPSVHRDRNIFDALMHQPDVQLYFYNNCKFLDTRHFPLPELFNTSMGVTQTTMDKYVKLAIIKQKILDKYNFTEYAKSTSNLNDIATFYMMTPNELLRQMIQNNLINFNKDCSPFNKSPKSDEMYICTWKQSTLYFDNTTKTVIIQQMPTGNTGTTGAIGQMSIH